MKYKYSELLHTYSYFFQLTMHKLTKRISSISNPNPSEKVRKKVRPRVKSLSEMGFVLL